MDYFKGRPIAEMTRDELVAALKEMGRLYQGALDEQVLLFTALCQRARPRSFWQEWFGV